MPWFVNTWNNMRKLLNRWGFYHFFLLLIEKWKCYWCESLLFYSCSYLAMRSLKPATEPLIINDKRLFQTTYPYPLIQKPFNHIYLTVLYFNLICQPHLLHSLILKMMEYIISTILSNHSIRMERNTKTTAFLTHTHTTI